MTDHLRVIRGSYPARWEVKRIKYALIKDRVSRPESDSTDVSFCPMSAIGDKGELDTSTLKRSGEVGSGYTRFEDGDVVVAKITPCFENGKGALARNLANGIGYGSTELFVLRANADLHRKFLYYATVGRMFRGLGEAFMTGAAGQKRVPSEFISDFPLGMPELSEQVAIADYLDRETERIDELVAEKKKMLALLEEKRQALITRAITRGLDPKARMKDSGVPWLGDVPNTWGQERAKVLFTVRDERSENGMEELLTVSHLTGVTPRAEKEVFMFKAESQEGYKRCYPGDFVVNTLWAWMGAMGVVRQSGIVSPDYHVYVTGPWYLPDYIDYLSRSRPFIAEVNRHSKGVWSSRLRLYPEAFFNIRLPVPPLDEQRAIVNALSTELSEARELETALKQSSVLLSERRTALITAAVTGQIDVVGAN